MRLFGWTFLRLLLQDIDNKVWCLQSETTGNSLPNLVFLGQIHQECFSVIYLNGGGNCEIEMWRNHDKTESSSSDLLTTEKLDPSDQQYPCSEVIHNNSVTAVLCFASSACFIIGKLMHIPTHVPMAWNGINKPQSISFCGPGMKWKDYVSYSLVSYQVVPEPYSFIVDSTIVTL